MEEKKELLRKIAQLESRLDHSEAELSHLNEMLKLCGFPHGIYTLKGVIEELLEEGIQKMPPEEPPTAQNFDFL